MRIWIRVLKIVLVPIIMGGLIGGLFAVGVIYKVKEDLNSFVSLVSQEDLGILDSELIINNQTINAPRSHDLLGVLKIEVIDFEEKLLYGTDQEELVSHLGFYSNSKLPGLGSNTVIMGLRNRMINIQDLQIGDEIILKMAYGEYIYTVVDIQIVEKNNREHFQKTDHEQLTLISDYPFNEWGTPTQSFVVIAKLVEVN